MECAPFHPARSDALLEDQRPGPLVGAKLPEALADVARKWSAVNGVPVEVTTTGERQTLDPEIEVALLRTAQEALDQLEVRRLVVHHEDRVFRELRHHSDHRITPTPARRARAAVSHR